MFVIVKCALVGERDW